MAYYDEVIVPLQWMVMDIQRAGMLIDQELVARYVAESASKQLLVKEMLEKALGYSFNPNSPKQVIDVLTNDLGLDLRGKKGLTSDELALLKATIAQPEAKAVVDSVLAYRDLGKKKGTYLQPVVWSDGRVRSQFRLYGTLTWRLSSREPDLQNLPRGASYGINIKNIYIAPPGYTLVEFDYSALEDRIPAYASGCKVLVEMFEAGQNTHLYRATIIFARPITNKNEQAKEYNFAKRFVYSRNYGASLAAVADKLLQDTHEYHPINELKVMADRLDKGIPEILAWRNACWTECEKTGVLYDGFGVPRLLYNAPHERRQVAYSWPTQATASGIMNRAMVRIYEAQRSGHIDKQVRCVCQVHDSLMFEIPNNCVERESRKIKQLMEVPVDIFGRSGVVFPTEAKAGRSWGTMKELKFS
jgi:DNA polymerase-1